MTTKSRPFRTVSVTISAQFVEISRDSADIRVGDDVTLKCALADEPREDAKDVANYAWYLNSESREKGNFY